MIPLKSLLAALFVISSFGAAHAEWQVEDAGSLADWRGLFDETRPRAPDGLPDGHVATRESGEIRTAWYAEPTDRYGHGVIGDAIEAGALVIETAAGEKLTFRLPEDQVFEDRTPRLADLDGDGRIEVVTIRASTRQGGSVAIYGLGGGTLVELAATPFIGRPNRWLNIAGIGDYADTPGREIALVVTPHIGGTLQVYRFSEYGLNRVAEARGFSNHEIGSPQLDLSASADLDGDGLLEMILPTDGRDELRIVEVEDSAIREIAALPLSAAVTAGIRIEPNTSPIAFLAGLADGRVVRVLWTGE